MDILKDEKTALVTPKQFEQLKEYSTSVPTGTTIGKVWKRRWPPFYAPDFPDPDWYLGEYVPDPQGRDGITGIVWRELIVVAW